MVEEDKDGKAERSKDKARAPPFACIVNSGCGRRPIDHGLLRGGSWLAATFLGGIFLFIVHYRMVFWRTVKAKYYRSREFLFWGRVACI